MDLFRTILFILFVLFVDAYAFPLFRHMGKGRTRQIIRFLYWLIPLTVILLSLSEQLQIQLPLNKNLALYGRATLGILYLSKTAMVGVLILGDGAVWLHRHYQKRKNASLNASPSASPNASPILQKGRARFLKNMALLAGAIPFGTLIYGMLGHIYQYTLERVTLSLDHLPDGLDGLKIIQISDIHAGSFPQKAPIRRAIEMINQENADLVFFTGDLVNDRANEMTDFMDVFDKIKSKYGVFSVLGNHDYGDYARWRDHAEKVENFKQFKAIHKKLGWNLLMNEHRIVRINDAPLAILGVENWSKYGIRKNGVLRKAYKGTEHIALKLLLSHDPTYWDAHINQHFKDIDITFSGHTHGFQCGIRIPGIVQISPAQLIYKQWSGLYQKGRQYIYVNRGLGFIGYPGRIGMLPEITVMTLRRA